MDNSMDLLYKLAAEVGGDESGDKGNESKGDKPDAEGSSKKDGKKKFGNPFAAKKTNGGDKEGGVDSGEKGDDESKGDNGDKGKDGGNGGQEEEQLPGGSEEEIPGNESGEGAAVPASGSIDPKSVIDFFAQNPTTGDEAYHEFAESKGFDIHAAEAVAYALTGKYVMLLRGGKSQGLDPNMVDPNELEMGIEVEYEHTSDPATAKKIALDHLADIPDYYTRLTQMEEQAKSEMGDQQNAVAVPEEQMNQGSQSGPGGPMGSGSMNGSVQS